MLRIIISDKSKVYNPLENTYVISADKTYISSTLLEKEFVVPSHPPTWLLIFGLQDSSLLCQPWSNESQVERQ